MAHHEAGLACLCLVFPRRFPWRLPCCRTGIRQTALDGNGPASLIGLHKESAGVQTMLRIYPTASGNQASEQFDSFAQALAGRIGDDWALKRQAGG